MTRPGATSEPAAAPSDADALAGFHPATRAWFEGAFAAPTAAQAGAWAAIDAGDHALVVAPTGSGKTLAAFLWSIDRLLTRGRDEEPAAGAADLVQDRIVYVSPLKALAADVERNLRAPLTGISHAAQRLGLTVPELTIGVRTGDTPPAERRRLAVRPPDILITTPESLFLVLTSNAREGLRGTGTVIVDEIHAVAGTKRGAHLAVSLERLDDLLDRPAQRVGLSATARPVAVVAEMLAGHRAPEDGGRAVTVVQPPAHKQVEVDVVLPVEDLTDLTRPTADTGPDVVDLSGAAAGPLNRPSIWPHVEERIVDLAQERRSTIVFTNSRRTAERLTARLNEIWAERQGETVPDPGATHPAAVPGQSGTAAGAGGVLARAHHGSMSRAERTFTETELKAGRLPVVVATSSLELGIDMGAVDLVIQVGSPPSVASGLQRVGRAGHQVGAPSHGIVLPTFRGDLVPATVTATLMRDGQIESLQPVRNPLDVLAQQIVAMVAMEDRTLDDVAATVRRSAPFAQLPDSALRSVLDMLSGRYPSEQFGELRARLTWDRATDVLTARPGSQRLAVTSGGTIPDRGLYGVFLAASSGSAGAGADDGVHADEAPVRARGGRRVGELDEEMVFESRAGDTFTLGSSTWRIEEITPDRVLVSPAPGLPGRLPFWKGDAPGRPADLGRALGAWVRSLPAAPTRRDRERATGTPTDPRLGALEAQGLDPWAATNLLTYVDEQRDATGTVPDDRTIVVERFRDELGDWRIVVHSPYGARVHAPWALVLAARLRERLGVDVAAMHADDGIVLRLPDDGPTAPVRHDPSGPRWADTSEAPDLVDDLMLDPEEVHRLVRDHLGGSVMFASRFREAAARALLLPRRSPDRRQPLWQQRQRSAQLLAVASEHDQFPIVLEAVRECLQDDFDVAALVDLMRAVAAGEVTVVHVDTPSPSPFAQSLLFSYTAQFLYDGDAPLAERRAAALTLDPNLLDELLGRTAEAQVADLLDVDAVARTAAELAGLTPDRQARHADDVLDMLRRLGPLTLAEIEERTLPDVRDHAPRWLAALEASRQVFSTRLPGVTTPDPVWAATTDAARLRDGLGAPLPVGLPSDLTTPVPDPVGDLVLRHARTHVPFPASEVGTRLGLPPAVVDDTLARLSAAGHLVSGRLLPEALGGTGFEHCHRDVMRVLRRRSLAALRAEVEPVPPRTLGVFLPRWQRVGALRGRAGLLSAIEQLVGAPVPASDLESHILPARVVDYEPSMLDELTTSGEVLWCGHSSLPGSSRTAGNGLVSLHLADTAHLTLPWTAVQDADDPSVPGADGTSGDEETAAARRVERLVLAALDGAGAFFLDRLVDRVRDAGEGTELPVDLTAAVRDALWELVWAGRVTNDSLGPVRELLGPSRTRTPSRSRTARPVRRGRTGLAALAAASRAGSVGPLHGGGRWSLLPQPEQDPTVRAHALATVLLERHGVVTRALAAAEQVSSAQIGGAFRVLGALESQGEARRGYFVEHLGGTQFAVPGAVDTLRQDSRDLERAAERGVPEPSARATFVLAATDPANPYGAALPWPAPREGVSHRPGRKAGAVVVIVDGDLVWFVERGGRTALSFSADGDLLAAGAAALAGAVRDGRLGRISLSRVDSHDVFGASGPALDALVGAGFAVTPRGLRVAAGGARA
ncbi:DEAD/DEAH box helicase [Flavimobilis soli]|nr:DEAD/DEAH box helicase [Flavimobilis soli]